MGLALISTLMIHDIYEFAVTNEGVHYYFPEPKRLIYVLGLALAGGGVALVLSRLSPQVQRGLKLLGLGLFALGLTAFFTLFAFYSLKLSGALTASANGWTALAVAIFGSLAALCWFEFVRVWRTGTTAFL